VAEVELAESPDEALAAAKWLKARLTELSEVPSGGLAGVAGSVNAAIQSFTLPGGACVEVWSDNYTALALRGDPALIAGLAAEYREAKVHG
jgi:hypothetical protein